MLRMIKANKPIILGLHKIEDPFGYKVHNGTFRALRTKGYLIGIFDANYTPSWYLNPHIDQKLINEMQAEVALGVV